MANILFYSLIIVTLRNKAWIYFFFGSVLILQGQIRTTGQESFIPKDTTAVYLVVLGTVQDAGAPQAGCEKSCCKDLFDYPDPLRKVVSLGLIDQLYSEKFLFEATPDMAEQMKTLKKMSLRNSQEVPDGIFLTHAHIGHYTGLMYLGKEAMNTQSVPVYAMPKMKNFLETNGPWEQLVSGQNIIIKKLKKDQVVTLNSRIRVRPLIVPHRDEYSETVGYEIIGPNKRALFIPDIDKWEKWEQNIMEEISKVDFAFLDATFFDAKEINNRDISEIPHPFIVESMKKFETLEASERNKIIFIHFNHTNPVLNIDSEATKAVLNKGFRIARMYDTFKM